MICASFIQIWKISIHALREEGDTVCFSPNSSRLRFLSTPSARRATQAHCRRDQDPVISIHALREEGDQLKLLYLLYTEKFLSTPSARRATPHQMGCGRRPPISIHALREEGD